MTEWQERAKRLADALTAAGKLHDQRWYQAVSEVPRHEVVSAYYKRSNGEWQLEQTATPEGLDAVYSNKALFVSVDDHGRPVSSSSQPGLMTRMLEMLDIHDGNRVLEIGAGTGYNAALLAHVLGDANVFSIDVDPELVDLARDRLASLGYCPVLVARDGAVGLTEYAPYDRIIATCAVSLVPWPWIEQVVPGGLILADIKLNISAGNLVLLRKIDNEWAEGRFDTGFAAFMAMRSPEFHSSTKQAPKADNAITRTTEHPAVAFENYVPWFLAQFALPAGTSYGYRMDPNTMQPDAATYSAPDGSWCEVDLAPETGPRTVIEAGPTPLWQIIEQTTKQWEALDQPSWDRLGVTVTRTRQWVWLDEPDGEHRWTLPKSLRNGT